jgi:hypothetical protein
MATLVVDALLWRRGFSKVYANACATNAAVVRGNARRRFVSARTVFCFKSVLPLPLSSARPGTFLIEPNR